MDAALLISGTGMCRWWASTWIQNSTTLLRHLGGAFLWVLSFRKRKYLGCPSENGLM